jgi:hypothetical protein
MRRYAATYERTRPAHTTQQRGFYLRCLPSEYKRTAQFVHVLVRIIREHETNENACAAAFGGTIPHAHDSDFCEIGSPQRCTCLIMSKVWSCLCLNTSSNLYCIIVIVVLQCDTDRRWIIEEAELRINCNEKYAQVVRELKKRDKDNYACLIGY